MSYLIKKNENYKNQILTLKNLVNKLRNDSSLWKVGRISGADQYQGLPPAMRHIDEALSKIEQLEEEFSRFRESLKENLEEK